MMDINSISTRIEVNGKRQAVQYEAAKFLGRNLTNMPRFETSRIRESQRRSTS